MSYPVFIPDAGTCMVTRTVLQREGRVQYMVREEPTMPGDTGWRFLSQLDTTLVAEDPDVWHVVDYNQACALEPALIGLWTLPEGSDLQLVDVEREDGTTRVEIWDSRTGQEISYEGLYLPPAPPVA